MEAPTRPYRRSIWSRQCSSRAPAAPPEIVITLAINYRWNVRLTDSQNGFRAIRRDVGRKLGMTSNLTTIEQEMLMKTLKHGFRVGEIASHEYERRWGVSKVVVWKLWFAYIWSFLKNLA